MKSHRNSFPCRTASLFLAILIAVQLFAQRGQVREPSDKPTPVAGVAVEYRIVGCDPVGIQVFLTSSAANSMKTSKTKSIARSDMMVDGRGIWTAYAGFGGLWPGGYSVRVTAPTASCPSGHFLMGGSTAYALASDHNPQPAVQFLYVGQEKQTSLDFGALMESPARLAIACQQDWPNKCLHPNIHLNNLGPEHAGSRWLESGSWIKYTPFWESAPRTATIAFNISEVSDPVGLFKYYVSDVDALPGQQQTQLADPFPVTWDTQNYQLKFAYQFEDSGTEIKGYQRTPTGLSDTLAPDINLSGPLIVSGILGLVYDRWNGQLGFVVNQTAFSTASIQAGGLCDLGGDLCQYAIDYKGKITDAVTKAMTKMLSQPSVQDFATSRIEVWTNGCTLTHPASCVTTGTPPITLDGAYITDVKQQGGLVNVKWVATHLYSPSGPAQAHGNPRPYTFECPSNKHCCEPAPNGACMRTCISKKQACP